MDSPEFGIGTPISALSLQLAAHEKRSQERYEELCSKFDEKKEVSKMEGINSDKVNINLGEGRSGGGADIAAIIAALGNRNQGNDNAALIAALGNRNDDSSQWGPLMAMMANRRDNDGMGNLWPILLLALLRGRGGFGGGDDCGSPGGVSPAQAALLQTLLEGQSDLRASVPEQTCAIKETIGQAALGIQQGFANTKDSVQASLLAQLAATSGVKDAVQNGFTLSGRDIAGVNQNVSEQGCKTREAVAASTTAILQKLDQNEIDRLRHERDGLQRQVDIQSLRSQVEVNQSVNTTQAQAQVQTNNERNFERLFGLIANVGNQVQRVRADQDIVNLGTMVASGTQATTSTQVR